MNIWRKFCHNSYLILPENIRIKAEIQQVINMEEVFLAALVLGIRTASLFVIKISYFVCALQVCRNAKSFLLAKIWPDKRILHNLLFCLLPLVKRPAWVIKIKFLDLPELRNERLFSPVSKVFYGVLFDMCI